MMNHRVRKTRTGLVFGSLTALLLGAAALLTAPSAQGSDNVCETGFTSDPAYVRECMAHGTREDAAVAWFVGYTDAQRTADCRTAWRTGDMVSVVRETRGDVITDNFRNGEQVIEWTARMGVADCQARGFGDVR